jgi:hypothetical protein
MNNPAGSSKVLPTTAPGKNFRPDLTKWVSYDLPGQAPNLTFAQRQAVKRLQDLKNIDMPVSSSLEAVLQPAPQPNTGDKQKRKRGANNSEKREEVVKQREQGRALAEAKRAQDLKRAEMFEARKKEREIAAEERRQTAEEAQQREEQHRESWDKAQYAQVSQEVEAEKTAKLTTGEPEMVPVVPSSAFDGIQGEFYETRPEPGPEKVENAIEVISAVKASSKSGAAPARSSAKRLKRKPAVKALPSAERIQEVKERAGDYSAYLPRHLGSKPGSGGPIAYAQLILSRRRGAPLHKRREAVEVIERFVGTREIRVEV